MSRAKLDAVRRLVQAAKDLDDYHACRLGSVVSDERRQAILAEHSAAVAGCVPFFVLIDRGNSHSAPRVASVGMEVNAR